MVTRKPVPPSEGLSRAPLPYPVTPTSPRQQQSFVKESHNTSQNYVEVDIANPWQHNGILNALDGSEQPMEVGQQTDLLPAPLKIIKSSESLGKRGDIPDALKPGSQEITPRSSFESQRSSDIFANPIHNPTPPPPSTAPPPPPTYTSTNPYRARSAERAPQIHVQQEDESSSSIWAELAENPTPSTQHPPPSHAFEKLNLEYRSDLPLVQEFPSEKSPLNESSLIDFGQAEDYRKELEASPFASAEDSDVEPYENRGGAAGASLSSKGKEREILPDRTEAASTDILSKLQSDPVSSTQDSRISDRRFTVSEDIINRQRGETYQIKQIRWSDSHSREIRTTPILVQNVNGPCPLLALVNALTLSTPPDQATALTETLRVKEQVTLGLLLDAVIDELMSGRRGDAAQELPDLNELYAFLFTLHTGMNVNPRFIPVKRREQNLVDGLESEVSLSVHDFRKPGTFEDTKEMMLYGTFSIPLIHGWIPPRSHAAFQSIERAAQSYEDAQNLLFREEELEDKLQQSGLSHEEQQMLEDVANIKYFLSSTATQLTGYGLDTITEVLNPGSIVILFRNDHFSTLYKQPRTGQLLQLVTDAGYAGHQEIVWESLVDLSGEGSEFLSGDFRSVGHNTGTTQSQSQPQPYDYSQQDESGWTTVQRGKSKSSGGESGSAAASKPLPTPPEDSDLSSSAARSHEQEDADLALAMQMQEDEEENARRATAARVREDELSKQFLSQNNLPTAHLNSSPSTSSSNRRSMASRNSVGQSRQPSQTVRPLLPPRRENAPAPSRVNTRPAVHRENDSNNNNNNNDDAPPSYEQASKTEPYNGPDPSHPDFQHSITTSQSSPSAQRMQTPSSPRPRGQSAYSLNQPSSSQIPPSGSRRRSGVPSIGEPSVGVIRRRSAGVGGVDGDRSSREKDCIIM